MSGTGDKEHLSADDLVKGVFGKTGWFRTGFGLDPFVLVLVCFGGLMGGLLYVATGGDLGLNKGVAGYLVACFGGICAAGIGVFVLANSNTTDRFRLLFFSVVCGFSYPVVLEAARNVAPTASEEAIAEARTAVQKDPVEASGSLAETIKENPALSTDPGSGVEIANLTTQAIEEIVPKSGGVQGVRALEIIGVAAAKAGYNDQARRAVARLESVKTPEGGMTMEAEQAKAAIIKALTGGDAPKAETPPELSVGGSAAP